ncbi:MAG: M48 family peptidase, partial [Proteobacteria bacterium]
MYSLIFFILFIGPFIIERIADLLHLKQAALPLPEALDSLQKPDDHDKAFQYASLRTRNTWFSESTHLVLFTVFWALGGFPYLATFAESFGTSPMIAGLIFTFSLLLLQFILGIPFSYYSTFVIEEKFGFNRTTKKLFVQDLFKALLLSVILGVLVLSAAYWLLGKMGENAAIPLFSMYAAFQIIVLFIAPVLILPLFLKLTPLDDGDAKTAIEAYRAKHPFKLNGVWVCDASKRSAKSNAFFTGFGKFRRLVLFDTLLKSQNPSELTAIVAHEAGHFVKNHIIRGIVMGFVITFVFLFGTVAIVHSSFLYRFFGFTEWMMESHLQQGDVPWRLHAPGENVGDLCERQVAKTA